jgi:hypothetical protein
MPRGMNEPTLQQKLCAPALNDSSTALLQALHRTHDASLDALLELRPDITEVGKRLIASLVMELEFNSPSHYPSPKDDWLTPFFGELVSGTTSLEDFARNNPVAIITYNYDRLLEYRLTGALAAHYGRPDSECIATLQKVPIIHLHGSLGPLPGFAAGASIPFGVSPAHPAAERYRMLDFAARRIVIVHEARDETGEFEQARRLLQSHEQVIMLGFGYGERNLARLQAHRWRGNIMGTVFALTGSQIEYAVRRPFRAAGHEVQTGDPKEGTREFLDNRLHIFREHG